MAVESSQNTIHVQAQVACIVSLSHDGRGVSRDQGKVVFIDNALPGERVSYRKSGRRRSYDMGIAVSILNPSPDRVVPKCAYFGVCGGCVLQHLGDDAQILAKQTQLLENLTKIGNVDPDAIMPPLRGPQWGYRRKARLGVRYVPKKGGVLVGFRERRKSYITALAHCDVLHPRIAELLPALRDVVTVLSCPTRIPQIEAAAADDACALVFRHLTALTDRDHAALCEFGAFHDVQVFVQPGGLDSVYALWPANPLPLVYRLPAYGVEIEFMPTDFIQVNGEVNRLLVARALDLLQLSDRDRVLDLFCGIGNFTLPMARRAQEVVGIEGERVLVERARGNARRNALNNARFGALDLYDAPTHDTLRRPFDKVLLDPPRTGAIEIIKSLPQLSPQRVVYISCNPATLARDASVLVHKHGFRLTSAGVVDMFPNTAHVESIAVFDAV